MRRAGMFLIISSILFVFSFLIGKGSVVQAGIISISIAFIYVLFPAPLTKLLSLLIILPLTILWILLGLFGFAVLLSICIVELVMPFALGYYIITQVYQLYGPTATIITTIILMTAWFMLAKYQWRLIRKTWDFDPYWNLVSGLRMRIENIWDGAERLGRSIVE